MDWISKVRETKGSKLIFLGFGLETGQAEIPFSERGQGQVCSGVRERFSVGMLCLQESQFKMSSS